MYVCTSPMRRWASSLVLVPGIPHCSHPSPALRRDRQPGHLCPAEGVVSSSSWYCGQFLISLRYFAVATSTSGSCQGIKGLVDQYLIPEPSP